MKGKKILAGIAVASLVMCGGIGMAACCDDSTLVATADDFVEAIANAEDGEVIKLTADIDLDEQLNIEKKITIDLNGKSITNTQDIWDDTEVGGKKWSLMSVVDGGELTISGNGTMTAKENDCYIADVRGGKLIVENGTFVGNVSAIYVYDGELEIKGGKFDIQQLSSYSDYRYTINCYDEAYNSGEAKVTITGGQFVEGFNPNNNLAEGPNTDFVPEGYETELVGTYYTVTKA